MTVSVDFSPSTSFRKLLEIFRSERILNVNPTDNTIKITNIPSFDDFGLGIFITLAVLTKRSGVTNTRVSFVKLDEEHTLLLVSPVGFDSIMIKHNNDLLSLIENVNEFFKRANRSHSFCDLRMSIFYNLSKFKNTDFYRPLFAKKGSLKKIRSEFPDFRRKEICLEHGKRIILWAVRQILENEKFGMVFGGNPVLLQTKEELFNQVLAGIFEKKEIIEKLCAFYDFYLTIVSAERCKSQKYSSDCKLASPFRSFEVDGIMMKPSGNGKKSLLVVETSSDYHKLDKLKNKLINFLGFDLLDVEKLLYLYIMLKKDVKTRTGKPPRWQEHDIVALDEVTGPIGWTLSQKTNFQEITSSKFSGLDQKLDSNWWDSNTFRELFDYYREKFLERVDSL